MTGQRRVLALIFALAVVGLYFVIFHTDPLPLNHESIGLGKAHVAHTVFGIVLLTAAGYLWYRSEAVPLRRESMVRQSVVLRISAIVLSLIAAAIHLVLSLVNLIPGEMTAGPVFAALGVGYVAGAVVILYGKRLLCTRVLFCSDALVLTSAGSRGGLPVDSIGLFTKTIEALLIASLWFLIRSERNGTTSRV